jgi:hypothetical protein
MGRHHLTFNNKGQARIIEAFLACAVVFSALLISFTFPYPADLSKPKSLVDIGSQTLQQLDSDGALGNMIENRNWIAIRQSLEELLPVGVSFNLTVFDENSQMINSQTIQNSALAGQEVVSVEHVCASQGANVEFFVVRLQLTWSGETQ